MKQLKKRIYEIANEKNLSINSLCINGNLTSATIFDFLNGRTKYPSVFIIKKICAGAGITLAEFYAPDYFNDFDNVYR